MTRVKARDKQKVDMQKNDLRDRTTSKPKPLKDLLASVTPENIYKEKFADDPIGKEIW